MVSPDPQFQRAAREWLVIRAVVVAIGAAGFAAMLATHFVSLYIAVGLMFPLGAIGERRARRVATAIAARLARQAPSMRPQARVQALEALEERLPPNPAVRELREELAGLPGGLPGIGLSPTERRLGGTIDNYRHRARTGFPVLAACLVLGWGMLLDLVEEGVDVFLIVGAGLAAFVATFLVLGDRVRDVGRVMRLRVAGVAAMRAAILYLIGAAVFLVLR